MLPPKIKLLISRLPAKLNLPALWQYITAQSKRLASFITSWWQLLLIAFAALIFLYYPIGGWMVHKIDTTTDYEIKTPVEHSAVVEMLAHVIKREVSDKMWTPNLPFIFPSYFLDNMPAFQMGLMSSVQNMSSAVSAKLGQTITTPDSHLKAASELLKYPGTIWMFSPQNKLIPVPSANSQYKKARKHLLAFNRSLDSDEETLRKDPADFSYFLNRISSDLWKASLASEDHIREFSSDLLDNRADDVFYFLQGKAYGYYLILLALNYDYKEVIIRYDIYHPLTQMLKALENASELNPALIRNGSLDSSTAPNSLNSLNYYTLKAAAVGKNIVYKIKTISPQGK